MNQKIAHLTQELAGKQEELAELRLQLDSSMALVLESKCNESALKDSRLAEFRTHSLETQIEDLNFKLKDAADTRASQADRLQLYEANERNKNSELAQLRSLLSTKDKELE